MKPPTLIENLERELSNWILIGNHADQSVYTREYCAGMTTGLKLAIKHAKKGAQ